MASVIFSTHSYQSYSTWAFGPAPSHVENNTCVRPKGIGFGPMTVFPIAVDSGIVLRLHWLMSSFFALSFVFQIAASMLDYCGVYPYEENVRKYGTHWMRFVEYSFSASVMIAGIGLQLGIMDLWMHVALFALTWICMMCGPVAEQLMGLEIEIGKANTPVGLDFMRWVTHLMGWIPQIVIYGILVSYFYRSQKTCDFDGNDRNVAPSLCTGSSSWRWLCLEDLASRRLCSLFCMSLDGTITRELRLLTLFRV